MHEFVPQRTCAYISQHDLHHGEMTVRETLDFSGRCLGVGTRYELLAELSRREKEAGIKPDPEIDAFMKATAMAGQETSLVTDYILKVCFSIALVQCRTFFCHQHNFLTSLTCRDSIADTRTGHLCRYYCR